jgi:myo-inositol 2-dehydrogenase / D-chiro-inositol 1-dehydrogenase
MMQKEQSTSRRSFLKTSTAAALGGALSAPLILGTKSSAASPGDTIRVGLIGCGGRGSGAAKQALNADKNVVLTSMADTFSDRLEGSLKSLKSDPEVGERVNVKPDNCFLGLDAYQKVIDSGVDVVILATPPGFRPTQLKAAIQADKHVFCEKPMATDAPGVRSVLETVAEAKRRKRAIVAGFCWRYNLAERAGFEQVHNGAIGDIKAIYGTYNTGSLWSKKRQPGWTDLEWQIRNWLYFTWLSGDHLVEQAVHTVDKMAWAMRDEPPLKAIAHGGRQVRTSPDYGHIFDHFEVVYEYPNDVRGFIFCRQQANCANDNSDTIWGTKGMARILGFTKPPFVKGETNWSYKGPRPDMYQVEHNELFASIRKGEPINNGVRMARSTMLAIMGRMAAYTGKEITWEEALNSQENLHPEKLAWDMSLPVPPVATPGKTNFI